jgi:hypothetical protein
MNPTTQPSEGAVRAAKRIARHWSFTEAERELVADLIDQETGAGELVALARTVQLWTKKGILKTFAPYEGSESGLLLMANKALSRHTSTQGKEGKL